MFSNVYVCELQRGVTKEEFTVSHSETFYMPAHCFFYEETLNKLLRNSKVVDSDVFNPKAIKYIIYRDPEDYLEDSMCNIY